MTIHPTLLLLAWIALAAALPWFSVFALGATSILLVLGAVLVGVWACWRVVERARVLLLALIVIYAFATPGAPLIAAWDVPTWDGLRAGALQAWRLLLTIVALALLLLSLQREQLLAGIYGLLAPFERVGLPLERIAVRLWLTLQYAEMAAKPDSLQARWDAALALPNEVSHSMTLTLTTYHLRDIIFVLGYAVLLAGALLW